MVKRVIVPGIWQGAEYDQVVSGGTRVGASLVIIRVAIRAWASKLEELRVNRRTTRVGRRVSLTATIPWITKSLARAPARYTPTSPIPTRNPEVLRARAIEVHQAPGGAAPTPGATLGHDQHRKVVTVHQTHVIEVQPVGAVQGELRQRGRRLGSAGALYFAGAAVGGEAGELSVGVLAAEGPCPYPTRPRFGDLDGL